MELKLLFNTGLFLVGSYFTLMIATSFLRPLVFAFEPIFRSINYLQWFLLNPIRFLWKNPHKGTSRGFFVALTLMGITVFWWILLYFLTLPLRVITAMYYDILLFSAISFADNIQEFLQPKRGKLGHARGFKRFIRYVVTLPFRFIKMLIKSGLYVVDSILMFAVSVVFPTLTMFHGTSFRTAGTKVTQSGLWYVGNGNYAGTGIYFGIETKTAHHYAPSGHDKSIILARVTLSLCKTIATLSKDKRELIGLGESGERLSEEVAGLYSSVEHWRDMGWWEYCILKPKKRGEFISSWRIRPVALVNNDTVVRTYGGFAHYCLGTGLIAGVISWFVILMVITEMFG